MAYEGASVTRLGRPGALCPVAKAESGRPGRSYPEREEMDGEKLHELELLLIEILGEECQSQVYLDRIREEAGKLAWALSRVLTEYARATQQHGPFRSPHEGLGVILEEFVELVLAVKAKTASAPCEVLEEGGQLAAMGLRFCVDVREVFLEARRQQVLEAGGDPEMDEQL